MSKIVNGFIIEAEKPGYYYHRSRMWIAYDKPEKGYVWTSEEVRAILDAANKDGAKWELKPGKLYPATYIAPTQGITEINNPAFAAKDFGTSRIYGGAIIKNPSKSFTVVTNLIDVSVSL